MSLVDETPPERVHDSLDELRHELKTPLTTIHGRAQLLTRAVRRSPSLTEAERTQMLDALTTIEGTVRTMVTVIDDLKGTGGGADGDSA